jgi:hypothetical protein
MLPSPTRLPILALSLVAGWLCGSAQAAPAVPVPPQRCGEVGQVAANVLNVEVQMVEEAPVEEGPAEGLACLITMNGSGLDWADPMQVVDRFFSRFTDWQPDFALSYAAATIEVQGFRKAGSLILMKAQWNLPENACSAVGPECLSDPHRRAWSIRIEAMQDPEP